MGQSPGPGQQGPPPERTGTVLETDEDIRQALLSGLKGQQQNVPVEPNGITRISGSARCVLVIRSSMIPI